MKKFQTHKMRKICQRIHFFALKVEKTTFDAFFFETNNF